MSHFMVRWLKLSLVVVVGCGFLAMMIYALINRDEIRSSQVEPPLIVPPSEPLKRRPDQPGGMQIPNRDKLVFDLLDSSNTSLGRTGIESGAPVSETQATAAVATAVVSESEPVTAVGMIEEVSSAQPAVEKPVSLAQMVKAVETKAEPKVEVKVEPKVEPKVEVKAPVKVDVKKVEVKPEVESKPVATGGKWGVQLAAVNSVADGNALAGKASKEFAALKGLSPKVVAAPGGKKFRVQFVGLKSREDAAAACAKMAGKQACFPVAQ